MYKFILLFSLFASTSFAQDHVVYFDDYFEFEVDAHHQLYADNVIFRKKPGTDAKALDTLSIGDLVTIEKKMDKRTMYNGVDWNWYKVSHEGTSGYILGGLISLTKTEIEDDQYFCTVIDKGEYDRYIEYRLLKPDGSFEQGESDLITSNFALQVYDNRGVEGIEHMLYVDYWAEACGMDGGGIYIFYDGEQLVEAMNVSSVSDGGVFWFFEDLVFPEDENGEKGFIIYEREHGEVEDSNSDLFWERSVENRVFLRWEDGKFSPDVRELEFDED